MTGISVTEERGAKINVLALGPLPPPSGGTTVLFQRLTKALDERDDVSVRVLTTGGVRGRGLAGLVRFLRLLRSVAREAPSSDVVTLHAATSGLFLIGPPVAWLAGRSSVPLIVRKFGGTDFLDYGPLRRRLILWTLRRSALYLSETRGLVEAARSAGLENAGWFSNSRPMPDLPSAGKPGDTACRSFVFLGQIKEEKGIRELISIGGSLPDGTTVDVYGDISFDVPRSAFDGADRVRYRGEVEPEAVHELLMSYDALVLPSYREGYPGVVLEAYAAGLPVVVTALDTIREIVDESCGILIPPRDEGALLSAIAELSEDPGLYGRLRQAVARRRLEFSDERWQGIFVEHCRAVVAGAASPSETGSGRGSCNGV